MARRQPQKTPPFSDLLRTRPSVDYTGLSKRTLYRNAERGLLTRYMVGGRAYWSKTELDKLVRRVEVA